MHRRRPAIVLACIVAVVASPCAAVSIAWTACPLYTGQPAKPPIASGAVAQCANVSLPLRHAYPADGTINVFVKRAFVASDAAATVTATATVPPAGAKYDLWLTCPGGPGAPSTDFEAAMDMFLAYTPGLVVYTADHRGVGRSSRLSCPNEEAPAADGPPETVGAWQQCLANVTAQWGDKLPYFNSVEAASDYQELITATTVPSRPVTAYGVSYCTVVVQNLMEAAPDGLVDRFVLDGMVWADYTDLQMYDWANNVILERLTAQCATHKVCRHYLTADPFNHIMQVITSAPKTCPQLAPYATRDNVRSLFAGLINSVSGRLAILGFGVRLARCNAEDVKQVLHALSGNSSLVASALRLPPMRSLVDPATEAAQGVAVAAAPLVRGSNILRNNIVFNEIWTYARSPARSYHKLQSVFNTLLCGDGITLDLARIYQNPQVPWPTYSLPRPNATASTRPTLCLNGDMDSRTPLWSAYGGAAFEHTNATIHMVPYAPHGTIYFSPAMQSGDPSSAGWNATDPIPCGAQLIAGWLTRGDQPTTCLDRLAPIDFDGFADSTQATMAATFGTPYLWGDRPPVYAPCP